MRKYIQEFKHHLAEVFDDNLSTKKWHNIVDWLIIGMILLSTAEIFISTFDIDPTLRKVLLWVDGFVLIFFTIEVTLRIWVAPLLNSKYKGVIGRLKYCFSFNGFIDVISTYPFYLQWLFPFPVVWLRTFRTFRVIRLFRISRYMKSWKLLEDTFKEKKTELIVSMQFLLVITLILSLILYFCEHEAQPENYDNGFTSVMWAFGQYIGDPGGFSENPPITGLGKAIACIVGVLGIAIVAVPAGILGSGFTEAIENENNKKILAENGEKLRNIFERNLDRPTGFQFVHPYRTLPHIQSRQNMTENDIINAVNETPGFRLVNLAATIPVDKNPIAQLAVEHFQFNRSYGLMLDRGSKMTIIAPSSFIDDCSGFFAYYLAKIGGFNYISREFGQKSPYKSYYVVKDGEDEGDPNKKEYIADIERLLNREGAWSLTFLIASGANEPEYNTQIHFGTGNAKGDESIGDLIHDKAAFEKFYLDFKEDMAKLNVECDCGKYHSTASQSIFLRKIKVPDDLNSIIMRMAWSIALWDPNRLLVARELALKINTDLLGLEGNPEDPTLKQKDIGYKGYAS